jgi:hypothetical protein
MLPFMRCSAQVFWRRDLHPPKAGIFDNALNMPHSVDVAADQVPAQSRLERQRRFQIDRIADAFATQRRQRERLGRHISPKAITRQLRHGEANTLVAMLSPSDTPVSGNLPVSIRSRMSSHRAQSRRYVQ